MVKFISWIFIFLIGCLFFVENHSIADKQSVIEKLMNEPVSMLDFGMYRLDSALQKQSPGFYVDFESSEDYINLKNYNIFAGALYYNNITINIVLNRKNYSENHSEDEMKKSMIDLIRIAKMFLINIDPETTKEFAPGIGIASYFLHVPGSFQTKEEHDKFVNEIRNITKIRVVGFSKAKDKRFHIECKSDAMSGIHEVVCNTEYFRHFDSDD